MLVVMHTMRGVLSVAAVGRQNCFTFFCLVFYDKDLRVKAIWLY